MSAIRYPVSRPHTSPADLGAVVEALTRGQLSQGTSVEAFEQAFADWLGVRHCVACSSGTAALHLALLAAGVGPGDEVIVPDLTFVATANAVAYCGARPVLCDVDPERWTITWSRATALITPRTRAIIPVHLYGEPVDVGALTAALRGVDAQPIAIIEDAAQALGAWHSPDPDAHAGTLGHLGTFSFYGNKLITAGEGGAVVVDSDDYAARLRLLRGQAMNPARRYYHDAVGYNYRMTELQGALLGSQLADIQNAIEARWDLERWYDLALENVPVVLQRRSAGAICWTYTVLLPEGTDRDRVQAALLAEGIDTRPAFVPLHRLPMYRMTPLTHTRTVEADVLLTDNQFPHASAVGDRGLSLPTYRGLAEGDVQYICGVLAAAIGAAS